eukprot:2943201-Pleurochrysis_carterae.AAC.1
MNEDEPLLEAMLRKLHADHHRSIIVDKDEQTVRNKLYHLSSAHSRSNGCEEYVLHPSSPTLAFSEGVRKTSSAGGWLHSFRRESKSLIKSQGAVELCAPSLHTQNRGAKA